MAVYPPIPGSWGLGPKVRAKAEKAAPGEGSSAGGGGEQVASHSWQEGGQEEEAPGGATTGGEKAEAAAGATTGGGGEEAQAAGEDKGDKEDEGSTGGGGSDLDAVEDDAEKDVSFLSVGGGLKQQVLGSSSSREPVEKTAGGKSFAPFADVGDERYGARRAFCGRRTRSARPDGGPVHRGAAKRVCILCPLAGRSSRTDLPADMWTLSYTTSPPHTASVFFESVLRTR